MARMQTDGRTSTALGPTGRKPNIDARRAYQLRVAGDTEYQLYTTIPDGKGGQKSMNADGVRPQDGAAVDAKYVGQQPSCKSPLRLNNVDNVPDYVYQVGSSYFVSADRRRGAAWSFTTDQLTETVTRIWPGSTVGGDPDDVVDLDVAVDAQTTCPFSWQVE
jgi:hypothetical protein